MKILIADDNSDDREVLRIVIEKYGHAVVEAGDGREGLELAAANKPDLIISDVLMPVMDGFQFLRDIKQDKTLCSIPFIFYSANYKRSQDVQLAMSLGAEGYIIKPRDPVEMWEEVERMIKEGKQEKAVTAGLIEEDEEYLKRYSQVVATKLEEKIKELEHEIDERQLAEERLRQSDRIKTIMARIATVFLSVPDEEIYREVLKVVLDVMESEYGIFGFIADNGDLIIPSMTRGVWDRCQIPDKSIVFPPHTWGGSLWGRAIREKKAFYSNAPFHVPEGHLPIFNFLAAPIIFGNKTIGLLSVGNKEGGYSEENKALQERIANSISPILNARLQRDLQEQERERTVEALRKSEERFRAIFERSAIGKSLTAPGGELLKINQSFADMLGYTVAELQQLNFAQITHPDDVAESRECIRTLLAGLQEKFRLEKRYIHKNGGIVWADVSTTLLRDEQGTPIFLITSIVNITDRKLAEEENKKLESELRQAQKLEAVGVLAGGIAHDFNNILSAIIGFSELASLDTPPGSEIAQDLAKVLTSAHRATDLVKQILAFSRQSTVERIPLNIQPLVKEALKMLRASFPATIRIKENIQACGAVLAAPTHIHQIVMNLCTNGLHAMEKTGGTLTVGVKTTTIVTLAVMNGQQLLPGEYVELIVSDTGTGIGPDIMDKIFDPYFTTKEVGKGTGLGLSISRGIVNSYGGIISVESTIGQGATFHVYLPLIHSEVEATVEAQDAPRGKERILFVDDEEFIVEVTKKILERLGYAVTAHNRAIDALAAFMDAPGQFDLVITDLTMPGLTGIDLARRMLLVRPDLPIILCTGFSNLVDEESAKVIGIRALATKPLTHSSIGQLVSKVLGRGVES